MAAVVFVPNEENSETDALVDPLEDKTTEGQIQLQAFWPEVMDSIKRITTVEPGNQILPLARIKKIMKLDEDVKMISAEAPLLFAKAAEIFIHELTLRSWLHTEDNKRRTLQRNDIAMAIAKYDQFDFLIDIVPREEMKPVKKEYETKNNVILNGGMGVSSTASGTTSNNDQVQYYLQLAQQHQQALQGQTTGSVVTQLQQAQPTIQVTSPGTMIAAAPTQNILVTNPATSQTQSIGLNNLQAQTNNNNNQIQLVQQLISNTGEVTQIPIPLTQSQLNYIRSHMQVGTNQPILIQQQPQQGTTLMQAQPGNVFLNASPSTNQQQQQQQQQLQPQQHQHQQQSQQQMQQQQMKQSTDD